MMCFVIRDGHGKVIGSYFPFIEEFMNNYIQRERVPRQEVKDAEIKSLSDKKFKNEKDQRDVSETLSKDIQNPRGQR